MPWWRHQMETFSALLALCAGNSTVTSEFPAQRRELGFFFDLCLNERLSKQSWGWWFETPSHQLWCHCNVCKASNLGDQQVKLPYKFEIDRCLGSSKHTFDYFKTHNKTVWCCYNVVVFLQNPHKRHAIASPFGRDMVCLLWVQSLNDILPESLWW